jgi:hypothetical protein
MQNAIKTNIVVAIAFVHGVGTAAPFFNHCASDFLTKKQSDAISKLEVGQTYAFVLGKLGAPSSSEVQMPKTSNKVMGRNVVYKYQGESTTINYRTDRFIELFFDAEDRLESASQHQLCGSRATTRPHATTPKTTNNRKRKLWNMHSL